MPRKIGYGNFTPARQAALKKAQLESARKRRKHGSETRHFRRRAKSETRSNRKRKLVAIGAAAAAGVAIAGGAAYAVHKTNESNEFKKGIELKKQGATRDNPLVFDTSNEANKKEAIAFGKSMTTQHKKEWYKTPEGKKQFDAVQGYASVGAHGGNDYDIAYYLRTGNLPPGGRFRPEVVDSMDAAFDSEHVKPLTNWTEVNRGSSLKDFLSDDEELNKMIETMNLVSGGVNGFKEEELNSLKERMLDKEFVNKSFTSTSLSSKSFFDTKNTQISFRLPPGTRALYVANNMEATRNPKDHENYLSAEPHEEEVILRKNTKYKIVDMKLNERGRLNVIAEVILDG